MADDEAQCAQIAEARAGDQARVAAVWRQRAMWMAGIAVFAALLAIVGWTLALWPIGNANQPEAAARLGLAHQLAAQSLGQLNVNNDLAWLLAIEAGRRAETVETTGALRRAFAHRGRTLAILSGHTEKINSAVWNADESRVLTSSNDGTARVDQAVWNEDGSRILTASGDRTAQVWAADSGVELMRISGHTGRVFQAIWNVEESRILTTDEGGSARVWDAESGAELLTLSSPTLIMLGGLSGIATKAVS